MDNILNIEMQGLSAANNLSIGGYVLETSSIADMITSKQKLPFKFGVFNQSNSKNEIEVTGESEEFMAIFAAKYKAIHKMFSDDIEIEDNGMARAERYVVNSVLLSAAIANQSVVDKVTIKLQHLNQSVATDSVCAFWNQSGRGFWSTVGCQKLQSSNSSTTCLCSHLTNFAILALVEKFQISEIHQKVLSIITLVFSGLSMFFLIIGIIIILLILIGYKKRTRHIIHLNLMVTLLFAQTIFVFGAEAVENKVVCKSIAYILHYFWLASFGWMLIEGVYLYILVLKVFAEPKKYMKWFFLIAWGMPLIIVGVTSLTNSKAYSTSNHCWLSNSHHAIWAFLGPILGIITINGTILLLVLVQIIKLTKSNKLNDNLRAGFRSSVILLPILGVTWIFGFLTFGSETIIFQYIFAVLNSSQGFLLTLFHCLLNEEVFTGFKRRLTVLFYSSKFSEVKLQSPLLSSFRTSEFSFVQKTVPRSEKSPHIQSSSFS